MTDRLTKMARGMPCQIRLSGCDGGGVTTVLAHYRSVSLGAGMGKKPASWLGAWACFHCHNLADSRTHVEGYTRDQVRLAHAEGILRTLIELNKKGAVTL